MRLVAAMFTLLALAASAATGYALWQQIETRDPSQVIAATAARGPDPQPPAPAPPPRRWPALFGERLPPAPTVEEPQPPQEEPQPPPQPVPPLESLGYKLNGVVRSEDQIWALVGHPTGQFLLSIGEILAPGIEVVAIDAEGVWLSRSGNVPELLGFPE